MNNIIRKLLVLTILINPEICPAQQVNWRSFKPHQSHIAGVNIGWNYGLVAGLGYAQKLKTTMPVLLNIEYSAPFGNILLDEFKTKLGGQAEIVRVDKLSISVKAYGIFRRYKNELTRLSNFGSEFSSNFGYYKDRWYLAGEFGFDKAITTHIRNTDKMKMVYPGAQDGWYLPTGGNFFYGIGSGYSLRNNDVYLKIGKTVSQDFKTAPTIPFYLQVGFNQRF